jgi:ribosome-binding factor A
VREDQALNSIVDGLMLCPLSIHDGLVIDTRHVYVSDDLEVVTLFYESIYEDEEEEAEKLKNTSYISHEVQTIVDLTLVHDPFLIQPIS